ncbi:hypothetical protein DEV91_10482 [Phyllobacterium brassicacearum]|uniref:hypothetical protein n=1 Tax=Phyllobacterium brassicacearum TaxID=314235 RepID=UPI000D0FEAE9|nr:hypothetical protein [Phyllobacterium brassicacearum]TDQ33879.1 hypothetical protein DEV91_10482 [Phyllobacterium brassicacearum]
MCSSNEVFTIKNCEVENIKAVPGSSAVKGMLTIAFVVAVSLCTTAPTMASEARSKSIKLGYPGSAKTYVITRKTIKTRNVVSVARAPYLGRAPFICTPSGFGRTSTCFAR